MDNRAALQAAGQGTGTDALDRLRHGWGEAYQIDQDTQGWRARRRDGIGPDITAPGPDELWHKIVADYTRAPVPRDAGAGPGEQP